MRQTTAASCALSSFSEKYQWPELASLRFEISPSTQTSKNSVSSTPWMRSVSSETRERAAPARLGLRRARGLRGARSGCVALLRGPRVAHTRLGAGFGLLAEVEAFLAHLVTVILIWPRPAKSRSGAL